MPPRELKPLPTSFDGPFAAFFEAHVLPNLPDADVVERYWEALVEYVDAPGTRAFVLRHFGEYATQGRPYRGEDANFFVGDNSPALWMYARTLEGELDARALVERIARRELPIAIVCSKRRGETRTHWPVWGVEPWIKRSFYAKGFYLAHLADAAMGLDHDLASASLRTRMLRLLSPVNYLPMPTHHRPNAGRRFHFVDGDGRARDLSLAPGIKDSAKALLADFYGPVVRRFFARVGEPVGTVPPGARISFRRRTATELPALEDPSGALVLVPSGDREYLQIRDFGVAYCGDDGTQPFDVVVRFGDVDVTFFGLTVDALGDWDPTKPNMIANTFSSNRNIRLRGREIEVTRNGFEEFERAVAEGRYENRARTTLTIRQRVTGRAVVVREDNGQMEHPAPTRCPV